MTHYAIYIIKESNIKVNRLYCNLRNDINEAYRWAARWNDADKDFGNEYEVREL